MERPSPLVSDVFVCEKRIFLRETLNHQIVKVPLGFLSSEVIHG
jgi:hypothetical protein